MTMTRTLWLISALLLAAAGCAPANDGPPSSLPQVPDTVFLVASDTTSHLLFSYELDPATGAIALVDNAGLSVDGAFALASSPDGRFVFAAGAEGLTCIGVDVSTGALTAVDSQVLAGANATFIAVHPFAPVIYVADGTAAPNGKIFIVGYDASDGTLGGQVTVDAGGLDYPHGLALTPNGALLYAANYASGTGTGTTLTAFVVNATTGALAAVAASPFDLAAANTADPRNLAITPAGDHLVVVDESSNPTKVAVASLESTTGALTGVGRASPASGALGGGIAIAPNGAQVYATNRSNNTVSTYALDATTGALTFVETIGSGGVFPQAIAIEGSGSFVYVANLTGGTIGAFSRSTTGSLSALSPANYALPGAAPSAGYVVIVRPL